VIVTDVPPATGPKTGLKAVTLVGVIRSSSSSSPILKPWLVRRPWARRRTFLVENRDGGTNDDMKGSPGGGRGHVISRRSEDAVATYLASQGQELDAHWPQRGCAIHSRKSTTSGRTTVERSTDVPTAMMPSRGTDLQVILSAFRLAALSISNDPNKTK
jgi:hypothetical protein